MLRFYFGVNFVNVHYLPFTFWNIPTIFLLSFQNGSSQASRQTARSPTGASASVLGGFDRRREDRALRGPRLHRLRGNEPREFLSNCLKLTFVAFCFPCYQILFITFSHKFKKIKYLVVLWDTFVTCAFYLLIMLGKHVVESR